MTKLIVTPIDPAAPGSWRKRNEFYRLARRFKAAQTDGDNTEVAVAMADFNDYLISRLKTDDGTPIDELLDRLSANEFDELMGALATEADAVPPTSASSSSSPPKATRRTRRTG